MERQLTIRPHEPACDPRFYRGAGTRELSKVRKEEAKRWFENAAVKALSYQSLHNDAISAIYNIDNKIAGNPISDEIANSGASPDNPVAANMELKTMPAAHELGVLVEMRMKCLILAEGDSSWGHDLTKLWMKIRYGIRQQIQKHYANYIQSEGMPQFVSDGKIENDIAKVGKDFIDWRYEAKPSGDVLMQYMTLVRIDHVLECAMSKYKLD